MGIMICDNCDTEHEDGQQANPDYCIARMQEKIDVLENELECQKTRADYLANELASYCIAPNQFKGNQMEQMENNQCIRCGLDIHREGLCGYCTEFKELGDENCQLRAQLAAKNEELAAKHKECRWYSDRNQEHIATITDLRSLLREAR